MAAQSVPIDAALDAYGRTQFGIADIQRRAQGHAFGAFGLDPNECPYKVIASGPFWRLRDYTNHDTAPAPTSARHRALRTEDPERALKKPGPEERGDRLRSSRNLIRTVRIRAGLRQRKPARRS